MVKNKIWFRSLISSKNDEVECIKQWILVSTDGF
ncbi:unnamed protein product [Paramecium sonneborni]|uniref:Uncharacterized protein n=1 Tax=Paramecium sonneborni TaxID=65129 RepID=A0A8S1QLD2_9CILI|nr:unnamed protein product [Paramecium sonneborni]